MGKLMKKTIWVLFAVLMLILLTGCSKKTESTSGYQVYYTNADATKFLTETYVPQKTSAAEVAWELLTKMQRPTTATEQPYSLIPDGVTIDGAELTDGQFTVTFSSSYSNLDFTHEMLLRAGVVKTLTQISEIKNVVFHVGSDVLRDASGDPVGTMTAAQFLTDPVGINSYQYASLTLYFGSEDGDKIVRETRNVHYSSNTSLEKVVMEQLLKGPMGGHTLVTIPEDTTVLGITVDGKECTLNLSESFLNAPSADVTPEVTVYSIVNSLCDVLGVEEVQLQIEGSSDVTYRDTLSLAGFFHRNSDLIEISSANEEEGNQIEEPSIGL